MACPLVAALRRRTRAPSVLPGVDIVEAWARADRPVIKSASGAQTASCPLVKALVASDALSLSRAQQKTKESHKESRLHENGVAATHTSAQAYIRRLNVSPAAVDRLVFGTLAGTFKKAKDEDFVTRPPKASVEDLFEAGLSIVDAYHIWPELRTKRWWLAHGLCLWVHARKYPQQCSVATACQYLGITWADMFGPMFHYDAHVAMQTMGMAGFTLTEWHALGFSFSEWAETCAGAAPPPVPWVRWMSHTIRLAEPHRACIAPSEWTDFCGLTPSVARTVMRLQPVDLCQCGNPEHIRTYIYEWFLVYPESSTFYGTRPHVVY